VATVPSRFLYRNQKTRTFETSTYFSGLPIGQRLALSPNKFALTALQAADPNGNALRVTELACGRMFRRLIFNG